MKAVAGALGALALVQGCHLPREKLWLRVELPAERPSEPQDKPTELEVKPRIAESSRKTGRGVVALELKRDAGRVRLVLPGACPLWVDAAALADGSTATLKPLFDVGPSERVVGIDSEFEIYARPNCPEAADAEAKLEVTGGAPLRDVTITERGRRLRARTAAVEPRQSRLDGIIPISAREQHQLRSQLSLRVVGPSQAPLSWSLGVSPVARSSGLPNVGLYHPILLGSDSWKLAAAPPESRAKLRSSAGLLELTPDAPGMYRLSNAAGQELAIQSGRYDQTPLDCGRSDCHAEIAKSAHDSPMTQALASDLGGCHSLGNPECATACHAVGEPGIADGGFAHVAKLLGLPALPLEHDELPRALRRLGGVGCMACHGPGAIPPPTDRWAVLRSDVCAVCHDAPPRYGHVLALESSRMGHADHAPATRQKDCARCHTTWGAIGRAGPEPSQALGLGCVTCHDVHPHGPGADKANKEDKPAFGLLRSFAMPVTLPEPPASFLGPSRVCIACHAPSSKLLRPEASAAAIVAGQGGQVPETGEALRLPSPHAQDARGCLSCHNAGPAGLTLGASHGFRATSEACVRCHQTPTARDPELAKRALRLLARLDPEHARATAEAPWHASYEKLLPTPQQTRALQNVLLVLEDPAADVHHPAYARALLDAAERLSPGAPP